MSIKQHSQGLCLFPVTKLSASCNAASLGFCGIQNMGNTCYMSSVLQCIASLPPVRAALLQQLGLHGFLPAHPCPLSAKGLPCACCLVQQQIILQLSTPHHQSIRPSSILHFLQIFSKSLSKTRQEDAHEFLLAVMDAVERDTKRGIAAKGGKKSQRTLVEQLFCGQIRSQVKCLSCGHESNTYELVTTLSLDLQKVHTVEDSLVQFTQPEFLDGANKYKCDECKRLVPARKGFTLHDEPNVLVVHLKRFSALSLNKISRHIGFSPKMSLALFSSAHKADNNGSAEIGFKHVQQHGTYTLTGVLVHQGGSLHSGHYYAYVWDSARQCWLCANDSSILRVSQQEVLADQAYMLFYTRHELKLPAPVPGAAAEEDPPQPESTLHTNRRAPSTDQQPSRFIGSQLPPTMQPGTHLSAPLPSASLPSRCTNDSAHVTSSTTFAACQSGLHTHSSGSASCHQNGQPAAGLSGLTADSPYSGSSNGSVAQGREGRAASNSDAAGVQHPSQPRALNPSRVGGMTVLGPKSGHRTVLPPMRVVAKSQQQQQQQHPMPPSQQALQRHPASATSTLFGDLPQLQQHAHPQPQPPSLFGDLPQPQHSQPAPSQQPSSSMRRGMLEQEASRARWGHEAAAEQQQQQQSALKPKVGGKREREEVEQQGGEAGRVTGGYERPSKASNLGRLMCELKEELYRSVKSCPEYLAELAAFFLDRQKAGDSRMQVNDHKVSVRLSTQRLIPPSAKQDSCNRLKAFFNGEGEEQLPGKT